MASGAAVAAGNKHTAQAAADILQAGGNAYDAVLAGMAVACIAEPVLCSFGGGGFLLAQRPNGSAQLYDFFTQTPGRRVPVEPGSKLDFREVHVDFGDTTQSFHIGTAAAAIPGMVAGLFDCHRALGHMPIKDILAPASALARNGLAIDPLQAHIMDVVRPIMTATPAAREIYCTTENNLLTAGVHYTQPEFSDFLDALILEGPDMFYRGDIAASIEEMCRDGGLISGEDLARYRTIIRQPRRVRYRNSVVLMNDLPSSGGPLIAFTLGLLQAISPLPAAGSPELCDVLINAMKMTGEARRESGFAENPGPETGERLHRTLVHYQTALKVGGTTHISVADKFGNLASLSLSNGEGNGEIIPGTGIMMNNMLGEEDLNPGGFFQWQPDSRVSSMMTPTVALTPDGRRIALGSGGSNRIRSAILQCLVQMIDADIPLSDAIAAPRLHVEGKHVSVEHGFSESSNHHIRQHNPNAKFWSGQSFFFGGVHAVEITSKGAFGAGDPRRGGHAIHVSSHEP